MNAVAKSFMQESAGRQLYYYTLANPRDIMLSKIIYNIFIMLFLAVIALLFYSVTSGYPIVDNASFLLSLLLGAMAFATTFSMISAIASKASNSGTLMAILSFPLLIPIIIILIRISLNAIQQNNLDINLQDLLYLAALNVMIIAEKIPQEFASNIYSDFVYPILRITSRAISCTSKYAFDLTSPASTT